MRPLTQAARRVVDQLVAAFENPETLVDTVAAATLIPNNSPCMAWSPANRFLVALHGTSDARGIRQWQTVGRSIRKGAKALLILVPRFRTRTTDDGEEQTVLIGFVAAPVFAVEDTEGEPLPDVEPKRLPRLRDVADALGVKVKYAGAACASIAGVYHQPVNGSTRQPEMTLFSHAASVFYHELAHALHDRTGHLRSGRSATDIRDNEIVAEVSAAVLVRLFEGQEMGRQAVEYIRDYGAKKSHLLRLLPEILGVVDLAVSLSSGDRVARSA